MPNSHFYKLKLNTMKKLLLSIVALAGGSVLFAQSYPASQVSDTKKAVLEEFTGIHCGFCPAGHAIADAIKTTHGDDAIIINVHAGSFAIPNAGEYDFRTTVGDDIDNEASPCGYPAGAMNRSTSYGGSIQTGTNCTATFAYSRGEWTNQASTVISSANSYVNVGLKADIDVSTNIMTVDWDAFFTANSTAGSNRITFALLQSNIEENQSGATGNPSQVLANGKYNHQHALRAYLTAGNYGDALTPTTMGSNPSGSFTYNIPASIGGIPTNLADMEIVAFIGEGTKCQDIVTGVVGDITYTFPAGTFSIDGSASTAHTLPSDMCTQSFTPEATFTNNSTTDPTDTLEVSYSLNGGTAVTSGDIISNVIAGGTYTHTFPAISLPAGNNTIVYSVSNGSSTTFVDMQSNNNSTASITIPYIPSTSIGATYTWDFESSAVGTGTWANTINTDDADFFVVDQSISSTTTDLGGYANSPKSFRHRLYNMANGQENDFVTYKFDLSGTTNPAFEFDYAYAQLASGSNDGLRISVSTDCGATWTQEFLETGNAFATGAVDGVNIFYPVAGDWGSKSVDLSNYKVTDVIIKVTVISATNGNCIYLDNINVRESTVGIDPIAAQGGLTAFPNPTADISTITFELTESTSVNTEIVNALGSVVFNNVETMNAGTQKVVFDGTELPDGIYFVNLTIGDEVITKKVSLIKQ